jgi:uncharacterized protein (DUF885 family)
MRLPSIAGFTLVLSLVGVNTIPGQQSAAERLQRVFDDHWEFTLRESPTFATSVGDRRYNDRLERVTLADHHRRAAERRELLDRLEAIDADALSREDRISRDILATLLADAIEEYRFRSFLIPITNRSGFHVSFPELHERVPLATVEDYENYVARLNDFRRLTGETIELMRVGVREGWILPEVVLKGIEETISPHIVESARESRVWQPFTEYPAVIGPGDRARLSAAGREAVISSVVPAYRDFLAFLTEEYIPASRSTIGASELPDGRAYYRHLVRSFSTLDLTPEEVHRTGLTEVARIRGEMEAIIRGTGFDGDFTEFIQFLRSDPRFYVESADELLRETAWVLKRMDGELPRLFGHLPRMTYGLRPVPDYIAPRTTTAYYSRPAGDGSRSGIFWLNTYDLASRPLYEIEALALHEAVPGHHLQIAIQQELEDLPNFRRYSGLTVFTEGWALYAERLGLETGFYTDPYSDFGRLTYEMWRACRLVVDTGMHYQGWTRQQAIDYLAENTALTMLNITNEVDRYIAWPGQALAYKIGELKIRELRAEAERALGGRFEIREFHDVVLGSGAVPLGVLEENVGRYVAGAAD